MKLTPKYWEDRYLENNYPWDAGQITSPLKNLFDSLENKSINILIPGCGTGHEAAYLHKEGFTNVQVCDWSPSALEKLKEWAPKFPDAHLHCQDFFTLDLQVDLIVEQTFFCAIDPTLRPKYVQHCHRLLKPGGKICGLLFADSFDREGPPFGAKPAEYKSLFASQFNLLQMDIAKDSIAPRQGAELFIEFQKK